MTPAEILAKHGPRETMDCDVVVVGAGPGGLAAAIRLKQLAAAQDKQLSVVVVEKASEPGAHILSGAVMDPRALTELEPNWKTLGAPLHQPVAREQLLFLTATKAIGMPRFLIPTSLANHGNYIISLGQLVRWLAQQAQALGVEIFPGFCAAEVLYNEDDAVSGVATGNFGVGKDGQPTSNFQLGMELHAKYTVFAEGSRGHLGRQLIAKYHLDAGKDPQSYAIGIKELWQVAPAQHQPGLVLHSLGWPMDAHTYGGAFMYHQEDNKVSLGLVTGLDYSNPWLSPFEEMQRWKTHPNIRPHLEGGKRIGYGARAITAGGLLSLPKTVFPGGALIGCEAGYLDFARIKGSHAAIKTGMLVADAAFDAVAAGRRHDELAAYPAAFQNCWLYDELHASRNAKQWFKKGLYVATLMNGVEQWLLPKIGVKSPPWTIHRKSADHLQLKLAVECTAINYPKPDGVITFDKLSSVFVSNTNHAENQPAHLTLSEPAIPVSINLAKYAGPESRYCPAGVYEFVKDVGNSDRLQINAQNCVHCKTCDIKDPTQNIVWIAPEGGGGPNYSGM
ncbi:MAG: electron transfer flavoprotein-ubiquinone oxidoreductase [Burkholderiaceae bacterium]|nr:electron transfer flavoprotein-ubiquinone oxidoreductase [Burkholderiaceae bacterium]